MVRSFARRLLERYGAEVPRAVSVGEQPSTAGVASFQALADDPLNPALHARHARAAAAAGFPYLAYAAIKTAESLGATDLDKTKAELAKRLSRRDLMNHNQHFRLSSLAAEIRKRGRGERISVLDVGGADGRLAAFIQDHPYCLADPSFNGISGIALPFADRSFDIVVSCHVLEHIPDDERSAFLDQLLSKARRGVILLNPFEVPGTYATDVLQLVIDVTDADWAREHLACSMPKLDDIRAYAESRGLQHEIQPNGSMTTTLALVFVDHFAQLAGQANAVARVNAFFNEKFAKIVDSQDYPTAHVVWLGRT